MIKEFRFSDAHKISMCVKVWDDGDVTVWSYNKRPSVVLPRAQADRLVEFLTRAGYGTAPLSPVSTTFWLGADA